MRSPLVLTGGQRRLIDEITATGLYHNRASVLTAALLLAKNHATKAVRFKAEVDQAVADIDAGYVYQFPVQPGSTLPLPITQSAFSDLDGMGRHDPIGRPAIHYKRIFETVSHRAERAAVRFRRSYLPEGTCLIYVWPYVSVLRTTPHRHELLRILHASIDGADLNAPGQPEPLA